jgi:putative sterol carrier protein
MRMTEHETNDEGMMKPGLSTDRSSRRSLFVAINVLASVLCIGAPIAVSGGQLDSTPQQVFDSMRDSFQANKAKGLHVRYQWELSGPNGGEWWIDVNDGTYKMGKGKIDNPSVTFITSDNDWVAMSNGKLKGTWAYMTGRLKVRGSQAIARKLNEIFP